MTIALCRFWRIPKQIYCAPIETLLISCHIQWRAYSQTDSLANWLAYWLINLWTDWKTRRYTDYFQIDTNQNNLDEWGFFRTFNLEPKIARFLYDPMLRYAYSSQRRRQCPNSRLPLRLMLWFRTAYGYIEIFPLEIHLQLHDSANIPWNVFLSVRY